MMSKSVSGLHQTEVWR